jgi:hypothetical protein
MKHRPKISSHFQPPSKSKNQSVFYLKIKITYLNSSTSKFNSSSCKATQDSHGIEALHFKTSISKVKHEIEYYSSSFKAIIEIILNSQINTRILEM